MTTPAGTTVQAEVQTFAAHAATTAALTVAAWETTGLPLSMLAELLGDLLEAVEHTAAALGDTLLVAALNLSGAAAAPLGITPRTSDLNAARQAATTVARYGRSAANRTESGTEDVTGITDRASRAAKGRATQRLGTYYDLSLSVRPTVAGYTRGLDTDPCELCVWLWRDGFVYPRGQAMYRHPGCSCVPIPVLKGASP